MPLRPSEVYTSIEGGGPSHTSLGVTCVEGIRLVIEHQIVLSEVESWSRRVASMGEHVSLATSSVELEQIGLLRYELYVAKGGKQYEWADHSCRSFLEPIDASSMNFQVRRDETLLGAVRGSRAVDALSDDHLLQLIEAARPTSLDAAVITSRLAFRPGRTARSMINELFAVVYQTGRLMGGQQCLASAKEDLVPLFERFGFKDTNRRFKDTVVGDLCVLVHDMEDIEHMQRIQSPLLPIAYRFLSADGDAA